MKKEKLERTEENWRNKKPGAVEWWLILLWAENFDKKEQRCGHASGALNAK